MTPRGYCSWTQLCTIENSEEQYRRLYFENQKLPINRGMALGAEVAESLETGEATGDIFKDFLVSQLPKLELRDKEFKATIEVADKKIPLFGKIDSAAKDLTKFYEYKTGTIPWNQKRVDTHGQITFYCVIAEAITGKIPQKIKLIYAPTRWTPAGTVELTGEIKEFKTKRSRVEILKMKIRILRAWKKINKLFDEQFL